MTNLKPMPQPRRPNNEPHQIHFEDFRQFGESFGMQLDDDSLLALYHVYDPQGTGERLRVSPSCAFIAWAFGVLCTVHPIINTVLLIPKTTETQYQHPTRNPTQTQNHPPPGYVAYEPIVQQIMDPDYFCMYSPGGVDNTQALVDAQATARLVANLRKRVRGTVAEMRAVFESFDQVGGGVAIRARRGLGVCVV